MQLLDFPNLSPGNQKLKIKSAKNSTWQQLSLLEGIHDHNYKPAKD